MRRRNTELHARVNGNIGFEFTDMKLTSYAGLGLFDRYLCSDPLLLRFARVRVWPTARTASRWLKRFTMQRVEQLAALNAAVVGQSLSGLKLATLTADVDGTVVSTGLTVERAERGYNPHHRKVPSYYPIMAHLAETTHVLRVNRVPVECCESLRDNSRRQA